MVAVHACFFHDPAEVGNLICSDVGAQKNKIMASGPITSWQIDEETVETARGFILGGSKITADDDCSHEIQRHSLEE